MINFVPIHFQDSDDNSLHIVLIFDEQDSYLQGWNFPNVTCIYSKNFDLCFGHTLVDGRRSPELYTLFVVLGGIKSVVKFVADSECSEMNCKSTLYRVRPTLTDSVSIFKELVTGALHFRQKIMEFSPKHQVIFSGLLPPSLYHIDKYDVDSHYDKCKHKAPLHSKEYFAAMSQVLTDAVIRYNTWAKQDSLAYGLRGWDLETIFTSRFDDNKAFYHILEADGQTLRLSGQEERKAVLTEVLEYTGRKVPPQILNSEQICPVRNIFFFSFSLIVIFFCNT